MKKLILLTTVLLVVGCAPSAKDATAEYPEIPEGLKDCRFFKVDPGFGSTLTIVRCPNSTTTTNYSVSTGKNSSKIVANVVHDSDSQAAEHAAKRAGDNLP